MQETTLDAFLGGQVHLKQFKNGYRATSDSVLVSAAVPIRSGQTVLDVGAGTGIIGLCLNARCPGVAVTGVELQADLIALGQENALLNHAPMRFVQGDVSSRVPELLGVQFHHVVTNPPFYTEDFQRRNTQSAVAFTQVCPLARWIDFCLRHLRAKGTFCMIHRTESLPEILSLLNGRIGALEVFPIEPKQGVPGKRIVIRGVMGSKKPFILRSALVMHESDDSRSAVAEGILRFGQTY